jgi:membrane carboxypeptidase/penicillin-binding protein
MTTDSNTPESYLGGVLFPQDLPSEADIKYNSGMSEYLNSAQIISRRRKLKRKNDRKPDSQIKRFGTILLAVFSIALFAGIITFSLYYASITTDLPSIDALPDLLGERGTFRHATRLYDRTGEQILVTLENPNSQEADYLFLELIPQEVINATLAARDPDFWSHPGFERGSENRSLAEQLISDLLLWQEPEGIHRTWRTRFLAAQITETFGREKILEWYLNNAPYGQLAFGIDEAAWVFFDKPAEDLDLAEASLLAATVDTPALNPIDAPQVASERQSQILSNMVRYGFLSEEAAQAANAEPIPLLTTALPLQMTAPNFTELALDMLYLELGEARVQRGGLEIITSLDLELQQQADCTLAVQIGRLVGTLPLDTLLDRNCASAALLPRLTRDELQLNQTVEGGIVILQPSSGEVLALSGDVTEPRQAGTVLSPFIYLTAFTRGMGPASLVWDVPGNLPEELDGYANFDDTYHGPMRVRTAAAFDYVIPMLTTLQQVGTANAWLTAQQSGLESLSGLDLDNPYNPVLEEGRIPLLEVTQAYGMIANMGSLAGAGANADTQNGQVERIYPVLLLETQDVSGRVLPVQTPLTRSVTTPQLAYLINDILSDETARRESLGHPNALDIGRPVGAKQGRGLTESSTWTIGYTPDRVVGVWLGSAENSAGPVEEVLTANAASGIWHAMIKTTSKELEYRDWPEPLGIVHQVVCDPSGLLPTEDCPNTVSEVFITGSEPLRTDNLYRSFVINTQTNRLATLYTPDEFLEERVYLVVPPEAEAWAEQEGLPVPPDTYDVIFSSGPPSATVNILSPEIFSYVSGIVEIVGNARGENFDFYRVRIGEGLNPRQWLQIGDSVNSPIEDDLLIEWDTTGLNGLYAVQLQVIAENQAIETASIQVTVDNEPPTIQVLNPLEGEIFDYPEEREMTFQVLANDNLGLARLEFWMDGHLLSLISDPPYTVPWSGTIGEHQLEIRAIDLAGNISITVVSFELKN